MDVTAAESTDELVYLVLSGRMDAAGVEKAETRFYALFAPRHVNAIFDLTKVSVLASMGLRVLISGAKTAQAKGFRVVLVAPDGPVRDVLCNAGIEELIPIAEDGAAARAILRSTGAPGRSPGL